MDSYTSSVQFQEDARQMRKVIDNFIHLVYYREQQELLDQLKTETIHYFEIINRGLTLLTRTLDNIIYFKLKLKLQGLHKLV